MGSEMCIRDRKTDITVVLDKWLDKYESIEDIKKIVQTVTVK